MFSKFRKKGVSRKFYRIVQVRWVNSPVGEFLILWGIPLYNFIYLKNIRTLEHLEFIEIESITWNVPVNQYFLWNVPEIIWNREFGLESGVIKCAVRAPPLLAEWAPRPGFRDL